MRALFDVNVLIALLDASHLHHSTALAWLTREASHGWASCPLTQNGCIRIMAQPAYPNPLPAVAVAERLAEACAHPDHDFWPDAHSLLASGSVDWGKITGHRQITDAYLLGLAVRKGGRFVTLDARLRHETVPGARAEHLVVLAAQ
ncbi:MAG: hypothetical protein Q8M20_05255 [Rhodocyclaceae bacterium]|nr:hypothetical protein [Rhodocyclaceae bacterium]MDZ4214169.1 TA system VapC family ribonuclease toxin [Rhodocyclaceae bacterium]